MTMYDRADIYDLRFNELSWDWAREGMDRLVNPGGYLYVDIRN